ncbi:MAG: DUF4331 family protein [Gemmatimonadaceae bacterium]
MTPRIRAYSRRRPRYVAHYTRRVALSVHWRRCGWLRAPHSPNRWRSRDPIQVSRRTLAESVNPIELAARASRWGFAAVFTSPGGSGMRRFTLSRRSTLGLVLALAAGSAAVGVRLWASDHQDTPEVELNPRMDINDVYAFPGATADRIALVMTTSSPIIGTNAFFDPNLLYQIKVDNNNDAVEDLVFQVTFSGSGAGQTVTVRGPVAPGAALQNGGMKYSLITTGSVVTGALSTNLGTATGTQVFAGLRGDPFFIDLEQFFKILPDRRPATGPFAAITQGPLTFRNPGVDVLGSGPGGLKANALSIVIELPKTQLTAGGSAAVDAKIGVWGTISR